MAEGQAMRQAVPLFALYGEPPVATRPAGLELDPVHIEELFVRAPENQWLIRPHRHGELHQLFWISRGGGVMRVEEAERSFAAPCLFLFPPGMVHGFAFEPGSEGHVLSLTRPFVTAQEAALGRAGWLHRHWLATVAEPDPVASAVEAVQAGYNERHAGRRAALAGRVLLLWSMLEGLAGEEAARAAADAGQIAMVEGFRALIEAEFRAHLPLADYARRLGTSTARLTRACRQVTGLSPLDLVHERLMLEAKRLLTYTSMSVSEISYGLGFSDAAYFSRFFARRAGVPPLAVQRASTLHGARRRGA
ncbi:helix-turn-helix domain-containing protein [Acetobacteraceae bacterium H6797]|nr:helix-turn-helix domain-containing protein [Acetobacteraceae bacterium H6797]